jgi:hypothetical protein
LQLDEATDVVKAAHLIIYIRNVLESDIKEDLLFCKPTRVTAISLEVFSVINRFLEEMKYTARIALDSAVTMSNQCQDEIQDIRQW